MTVGSPHAARSDVRSVLTLAITSLVILTFVGYLHFLVPTPFASRVNVRWAKTVADAARLDLERQLKLLAGEPLGDTTWAYDLADPSPSGIEMIIHHPSVEDTHYIDRPRRAVSSDAGLGTTRIRGGLSTWRDTAIVAWLGRLSFSFLVVSGIWLATTGRQVDASAHNRHGADRDLSTDDSTTPSAS